MDQDDLVADLRKVADDLEAEAGPLALFMVVASNPDTNDGLNMIVSAPGLDAKSIGVAVSELSDALRRNVRQSEWRRFLRVTPLRTGDPFVRAMNSRFHAEQSVINLDSISVTGIDIPRAVLLESKRVAA
jgi:hypothetical protein